MNSDLLVTSRHPPYGNTLARDALDVALTHAAFGQALCLLFLDDGVLQLLPQQAPEALARKNMARILQSLTLYDIDTVYADEDAMQRRGLNARASVLPITLLNPAAIAALIQRHKIVLSF